MEEVLYRWMDRFGFPVVMVFVMMWVVRILYVELKSSRAETATIAMSNVEAIGEHGKKIESNTEATNTLTEMLKKSLGSGPVCKAGDGCQAEKTGAAIVAELRKMDLGNGLSDKQILRVVDAFRERREKKITDIDT